MPRPTQLSDLLPDALDRSGVHPDQLEAARVCEAFQEVIKGHPKISRGKVVPVSYKYRILTVQVQGASLATELQFRASRLIETMNRSLGERSVERIRFSIR